MTETGAAHELLRRMPKAELHLHLEGTIAPETLWEMARRNQVALPASSLEELRRLYVFGGFQRFLELWLAMCRCLRREADYERMVSGFVEECARRRLRYVEAHFTAYNHEVLGIGGRRALEVVTRALEAAEAAGGPVVRLIVDVGAESFPQAGGYTAELLEELEHPLVVALGLGGPEDGYPRTLAEELFARARAAGYRTVAHAGETAGAEHVRQAVERLGAVRVQHGVRAVEDPAVLRLLAERRICCDVALTSNECLGVTPDLARHPLRAMVAAGVPVTLGSDDPPFFNTDLDREYRRAHDELGFSVDELWQMNLNGLRFGLADTALRRRLMREFAAEGRRLGLEPQPPASSAPA